MANLRDIKRRITSVTNTGKITRAMKLVAGAKLRRATEAAVNARPYQQTLQKTLERVVAAEEEIEHELLTSPTNETDVLVVVLSSDRGLCGSFNANVCRRTEERVRALQDEGKNVRLICYGKKACEYFTKRKYNVVARHRDINASMHQQLADDLASLLTRQLVDNEFAYAVLAFNQFKSVMSQVPQFEQVLPMKLDVGEGGGTSDYIYEPAGTEILGGLLPMALRTRLFQAFLETEAGEHAARMTAMDSATRNANELIDTLTLQFNRARQSAITTELTEIISGVEALK